MDNEGKIDLKEQLKSLFDTGINLSIGQIGAIQWAINQVAISKTETTSCGWCSGEEKPLHCLRGEYGESVCVGVSKSGGYMSVQKDGDNTLYAIERCPNCGRRLEDWVMIEKKVCPDCGGSGVYQEYDEYDRYYVHNCPTCDGSGEVDRQQESED